MWPVGYQCPWREINNEDLLQICIFSKTKRKMKKDILPDAQAQNLRSSLILLFLPYRMSYPKYQPTPTSAHSNFELHPEASQRHSCLYSLLCSNSPLWQHSIKSQNYNYNYKSTVTINYKFTILPCDNIVYSYLCSLLPKLESNSMKTGTSLCFLFACLCYYCVLHRMSLKIGIEVDGGCKQF